MHTQTPMIVVANHKGGVGKTTTAAHLAAGLTLMGYNTALVDTDAQGHAAAILGQPIPDWSDPNAYALYHLLSKKEIRLADVVYTVPTKHYAPEGFECSATLRLLPSNEHTSLIPTSNIPIGRFKSRLLNLAKAAKLDFIVIDTSPSHTMFDSSIMAAATHYLYVTQPEHLSMTGLRGALAELAEINEDIGGLRPPIQMLGIVPNLVEGNTVNHRENLKTLSTYFSDVLTTPVMKRTAISRATSHGQLIYAWEPYGQAHNMFGELITQLLTRLETKVTHNE